MLYEVCCLSNNKEASARTVFQATIVSSPMALANHVIIRLPTVGVHGNSRCQGGPRNCLHDEALLCLSVHIDAQNNGTYAVLILDIFLKLPFMVENLVPLLPHR
jgi:hypothetical protein